MFQDISLFISMPAIGFLLLRCLKGAGPMTFTGATKLFLTNPDRTCITMYTEPGMRIIGIIMVISPRYANTEISIKIMMKMVRGTVMEKVMPMAITRNNITTE
jgi:hypothetical protein